MRLIQQSQHVLFLLQLSFSPCWGTTHKRCRKQSFTYMGQAGGERKRVTRHSTQHQGGQQIVTMYSHRITHPFYTQTFPDRMRWCVRRTFRTPVLRPHSSCIYPWRCYPHTQQREWSYKCADSYIVHRATQNSWFILPSSVWIFGSEHPRSIFGNPQRYERAGSTPGYYCRSSAYHEVVKITNRGTISPNAHGHGLRFAPSSYNLPEELCMC